jgi:ankyrin repeat protein
MAEKPGWDELFRSAVLQSDPEMLRAAIDAGLPLSGLCMYDSSYTPLHYAAERGPQAALFKALIVAGADVNVRAGGNSKPGHTALMMAADGGRTALVRLLLAAGADVHVADELGVTAVTAASNGGVGKPAGASKAYTAVVRMLLDAGARPDAQTLQYAAWGGNPDIVQMILDAGVGPNEEARLGLPLMWAFATKGPLGKAEALLRAGADPDRRATRGQFAGLSARAMARNWGKGAVALLTGYGKAPPAGPR